mgnify:CR=1 FL=1
MFKQKNLIQQNLIYPTIHLICALHLWQLKLFNGVRFASINRIRRRHNQLLTRFPIQGKSLLYRSRIVCRWHNEFIIIGMQTDTSRYWYTQIFPYTVIGIIRSRQITQRIRKSFQHLCISGRLCWQRYPYHGESQPYHQFSFHHNRYANFKQKVILYAKIDIFQENPKLPFTLTRYALLFFNHYLRYSEKILYFCSLIK